MPLIDDIKESHGMTKGKGIKYKFNYFWEYYKWPTIGVIVGLIFIISIVKTIVTNKDIGFEAVLVNSLDSPSESYFENLFGIDTSKQEVILDNSYTMYASTESYNEATVNSSQKLVAVVAAGSADVFIANSEITENYFNSEFFADLRDYFSNEELEALGDRVIWGQAVDYETGEPKTDMMPLAINVYDAPALKDTGCYFIDKVFFSVFINTKHPDLIKPFYNGLYSYDVKEATE